VSRTRCSVLDAAPQNRDDVAAWAPDQQRTAGVARSAIPHSASKTRVNALLALRSIRGTRPHGAFSTVMSGGIVKSKRQALSAWAQGNEGVGEHVRTRFHLRPLEPVKLRTERSAPNEESLFLLPDRLSKRANSSKIRSSRLT
jgi:hypothetical protein